MKSRINTHIAIGNRKRTYISVCENLLCLSLLFLIASKTVDSFSTNSFLSSRQNSRFASASFHFAKKKNNQETSVDDMPANLKRKVSAKRDPLGHVIPEKTKRKGGKWATKLVYFINMKLCTTISNR